MTHHPKITSISLKHFLFLVAVVFAVAAALLAILFTSAATATGSTPHLAISLTSGVNTGILGPNEQRWFRIVPKEQDQVAQLEKALTLVFALPTDDLSQYVSMHIFDEDQIQFFDPDNPNQTVSLGAGQLISTDNDPQTGQLFWTGSTLSNKIYYVQILNTSDYALDYWLMTKDTGSQVVNIEQPAEVAESVVVPQTGADPGNAAPLMPDINRGNLKPRATTWYAFTFDDFSDGNNFQDLNFSLFFTPDDGNRRHNVNFELFTAHTMEAWQHGNQNQLANFGAGMLVSRDGDFNTGERIWQGTVLKGDKYFLAVENGSDVEIDYWLFDDDIYNPELGPQPAPTPPPIFAQGTAPQAAIPLTTGQNTGGLDPGQEVWYSFSIHDTDEEYFEEMALTMIVTPDDGNRIHHVHFDVFTADSVRNWAPGDNSKINNVGAGSLVLRDNNTLTGERFWSGWVIEDDLYYVQIRNGTEVHIDYWLFTADVYGPELEKQAANN